MPPCPAATNAPMRGIAPFCRSPSWQPSAGTNCASCATCRRAGCAPRSIAIWRSAIRSAGTPDRAQHGGPRGLGQRNVDRRRVRSQGADPVLSGASGDAGDGPPGASAARADRRTGHPARGEGRLADRHRRCIAGRDAHPQRASVARRRARAKSSPKGSANAARWCAGAATARSACSSSSRYRFASSRTGGPG